MKKEPDPKWFVLKTAWINIWEHNTNNGHIKKLISVLPEFFISQNTAWGEAERFSIDYEA